MSCVLYVKLFGLTANPRVVPRIASPILDRSPRDENGARGLAVPLQTPLAKGLCGGQKFAAVRNRRTGLGFKVIDCRGEPAEKIRRRRPPAACLRLRTVKNDANLASHATAGAVPNRVEWEINVFHAG